VREEDRHSVWGRNSRAFLGPPGRAVQATYLGAAKLRLRRWLEEGRSSVPSRREGSSVYGRAAIRDIAARGEDAEKAEWLPS